MNLVTGATGIVGSRIAFDLLSAGMAVRAMRRSQSDVDFISRVFHFYNPAQAEALLQRLEWIQADVCDVPSLEDAMQSVDTVYHCAALVSYSPRDVRALVKTNVEGTANVVNAALYAGVRRLCHVSSVAALGKPRHGGAITEKNWLKKQSGTSTYGLTKHLAELEVWRGASEGLSAVAVNPSIILGPAKAHQSSGQLMSLFKKGIGYYPPGSAGFVDVRDVSAMAIALAHSAAESERYILNAASVPYQHMLVEAAKITGNQPPAFAVRPWMLEVAWRAAALAGYITGAKPAITRETARAASVAHQYSNEKVIKQLGMQFIAPETSLKYLLPFYA
jgi:nucleoside-diphosphate-sugar epimerase